MKLSIQKWQIFKTSEEYEKFQAENKNQIISVAPLDDHSVFVMYYERTELFNTQLAAFTIVREALAKNGQLAMSATLGKFVNEVLMNPNNGNG